MKEKHNIDEFFTNRLNRSTNEEAEWNTPSDLVWEKASVHFVDRKKKKRRAIFWWFGSAILLLGIGFLLSYGLKDENIQPKISPSITKLTTESTIVNPKNDNKQVKKSSIDLHSNTSNQDKANNRSNEYQSSETSNITKDKNEILEIRSQNSSSPTGFEIDIERKNLPESVKVEPNNYLASNEVEKVNNQTSILNTPIGKALTGTTQEESNRVLLISMPNLDSSTSRLFHEEPEPTSPKFTNPILNKPLPKYEIGVLTTRYIFNVLSLTDELIVSNNNEIRFNFDFLNFGIRGSKWLNEKWSLTSDLKYTKGELDIGFCIADTLQSDINTFLNDSSNGISSRNEINSIFHGSQVELIDNIILDKGDILKINGNLGLKVKSIQLPIFLDYHIYKKKWEYTFGVGVSLGYAWIDASVYDLHVRKDDLVISKNVLTDNLNEQEFFGEVLGGVGIKYHLNKNWNIGTNFRISTTDLLLSSVDLGLYYRL